MQIDLLGTQSFAHGHPLAQYEWLRENKPVFWHEEPNGPGFWAITRYQDVWDVDRNFQAFSSEPTIMIQDPLAGSPATIGGYKMMLMMDPPQHTAYRRLIRDAFTLPSATEKTPWMNQLARQIVNGVIERGECDFVNDVAGEMPSFVIAGLMGLPLSDGRELYKLTEIIHSAPESLPEGAGTQAVMKMFEYGSKVIAEKRARPGDDLASKLLAAEVDGRRLEDMEFLLFFLLLVDAGGDTTRNLLSAGFLAMMDHPDQLAWLRSDPASRLNAAREELLRYTTPVIYMRRTARKDTVVGGETIMEGDKVVMYFGSANRDPRKFERPGALDLKRTPNEHIAFGTGAHACLGQHIARIEIDAIITEVLARMDKMELAGEPEWLPSNFISGPKKMPVTFKPGPKL